VPLLLKFALEYVIRYVQQRTETEWNTGIYQFLSMLTILVNTHTHTHTHIYIIYKNTEALLEASSEVGLEVNTEKINMAVSHDQNHVTIC